MKIEVPDWQLKWAKKDRWDPLEAALLLTGEDPDYMGRPRVAQIVLGKLRDKYRSFPIGFVTFLRSCGFDPLDDRMQGWDATKTPNVWVGHALKARLNVPEDFCRLVEKFHGQQSPLAEKPLDPRERQTLNIMIATMAYRKYAYYGPGQRSPSAAQIRKDMKEMFGTATVSEQTIRNRLKTAWEEVPGRFHEQLAKPK